MIAEYISNAVSSLKKKYDESNPFRLAKSMGICLIPQPMGTDENCCKGFFMVSRRIPAIIYNDDLPERFQEIIVMHEIGHAVLHRKKAEIKCFHDFQIFDSTSGNEYEANMFAADYMLEDQDVLDRLNSYQSFFETAQELRVPPELLDFKFKMMKMRGTFRIDSPIVTDSTFLKNVPTKDIYEGGI